MKKEIYTKRLYLRPLQVTDLPSTHAYAGNPENTKYMMYLPNENIHETERFLRKVAIEWEKENPSFYEFAVVREGAHMGAVSLCSNGNAEWELGWILHKDFWGKGYVVEAVEALLPFAIKELGAKRFVAHCDAENTASRRVMEKIGMRLFSDEGTRYNKGSKIQTKELIYCLEE